MWALITFGSILVISTIIAKIIKSGTFAYWGVTFAAVTSLIVDYFINT